MTESPCLSIGRSLIPRASKNMDRFCSGAANAMLIHPELAADICLAATERLMQDTTQGASSLRINMEKLILQLCIARDQSTQA